MFENLLSPSFLAGIGLSKQPAQQQAQQQMQSQISQLLGGGSAPTLGFNEAPGYAGHYGYDPHARATDVVDGKLFYNQWQPKVYTGNDRRESFIMQDWSNPDWIKQQAALGKIGSYTDNGTQGFLVDPSIVKDPNFSLKQTDQYRNNADLNGGLKSLVGPALAIGSVFFPPLAPYAAAYNIGEGIHSGNWAQAATGALGIPGVGGAIGSTLGSGLSTLGVPASAIPYVSKGLLSAGTTALGGGDFKQMLTNGLASGAGAYGGNYVGGLLNGSVPSYLGQGISQATAGALGNAIKGGDVGQGALWSGLNGLASGLGKDWASGMDAGIGKSLLSQAPGAAVNYFGQQQAVQQRQQQLQSRLAQIQQARPPTMAANASAYNTGDPRLAQLRQRIAAMRA